ncbi:MAG TPA: P-loop NTPase fold protein [Thermoanaerobaculia bacterium]|nr:P-loop NTPase fold protein [Thermoanaerobaculia bacterium]
MPSGKFVGTATLVSPAVAVVPLEALEISAYSVRFDGVDAPITVVRIDRDHALGIALLFLDYIIHTSFPVRWGPPATDGPCVASWYAPDGSRLEAKGAISRDSSGNLFIHDVEGMIGNGAAVISTDDRLIGIVVFHPQFKVIPVSRIRAAIDALGISTTEKPPALGVAALLPRMTDVAQRTMIMAERIRQHVQTNGKTIIGHLHIEFIVLALTETSRAFANLLVAKSIDRPRLLKAMSDSAKMPLEIPPLLSTSTFADPTGHAQKALDAAMSAAGAKRIDDVHLLHGILSLPECSAQRALVALGLLPTDVQLTQATRISGFQADSARGEDLFGLETEVRALCSVLAAKEVKPPISVGLFGEWGSGKSFFMAKMEKELQRIADDEDPEVFCHEIIQLWFNAWHYSDSNLWASLTSEIFNGLDRALHLRETKKDPEKHERDHATHLKELADAKARQAAQEAVAQKAEAELRAADEQLRSAADAKTAEKSLHFRTILHAAPHMLLEQDEVKAKAAEARNEIVAAAANAGLDVQDIAEVRPIVAEAKALFVELRHTNRWWLVVVGAVAAIAFARFVNWNAISSAASAVVGACLMLVTPALKVVGYFKPALKALRESRAALQKAAEEQLKEAIEKKQRAEDAAVKARAEAQTAAGEVAEKEKALAETEPERKFATFVQERQRSDDYRRQLGVIALAHNDFRELSTLFDSVQEKRAIERIVLYIDDLDRCPENKVMDVLQAVHLLLAFPLFVVVVGVDSRWLLHSVRQHSKAFTPDGAQQSDPESAHWRSTPINYLEKIFQIPLTLRPMPSLGFEKMVDRLTAAKKKKEESGGEKRDAEESFHVDEARLNVLDEARIEPSVAAAVSALAPARPAAEYLQVTPDEGVFMKQLFPLMPSPRAAKRFINVYRLIRARQDSYELGAFLAKKEYEPLLLLLAIVTGYPVEATYLLQGLMDEATAKTTWQAFLGEVHPPTDDGAQWQALLERLTGVHKACNLADDCAAELFVKWAPEVARYSFHSGRILGNIATVSQR